jgi:hypothetical protein
LTWEIIIPVSALAVTILIFTYTQWQKKRVESAQLTLELGKRMFEPNIKATREILNNAMDDKTKTLIIEDTKNVGHFMEFTIYHRDLEDYLNELEQIGLLVNKKVLDGDFAFEMFGFQIISVWEYPEINEYIKKQREDYREDLWNQFEKAYEKFKPLSEKVTPANRKFSINKK